jgi:hypothetical protein
MTNSDIFRTRSWAAGILVLALIVCPAGSPDVAAAEKAVQSERNPPGDISDDQVFVPYTSPLGFTLQVPEGWSRADREDGARFYDKYNIIDVSVAPSTTAPNAGSVRSHEAALAAGGRAVKITSVKDVRLNSGPAVQIVYTSNSEPNPLTNKQIRLEHERFIFFKDGKAATADFAAPAGADNADQWRLMAIRSDGSDRAGAPRL